jgi:hypothetical protein
MPVPCNTLHTSKWIQTKDPREDKEIAVNIPGEISERAKKNGVEVPWKEVMVSKKGIILLLSVVSVTMVALWRLRPNMK